MLKPLPDGKIYNFFIDDNVFLFTDIYRRSFASPFDQFYLASLKRAHERFGTMFTLNTFYHNWHEPDFNLSKFSDRCRAEFEANSSWLRFAFHGHSEFPEHPYSRAYPEKLPEHYRQWRDAMCRIVGEQSLIAPVIFHYFDAADACRRFMRGQGMKIYAIREGEADGGVYNPEFDQFELPVDIFLNRFKTSDIRAVLERKAADREKIMIGSHEQYAYRHYENYLPEYFDGLFAACEIMAAHGFECAYFNELA